MGKIMKAIRVLVVMVLVFSFSACGNDSIEREDNSPISNNAAISETNDAEQSKTEGIWDIYYYVDEFDEPTDERYIDLKEDVKGVFSNSATTNSELYVGFAIDENEVGIFLYEYDYDFPLKGDFSDEEYTISLKKENGEKATIAGKLFEDDDRITIKGDDKKTFIDFLCGEEKFKVYIENNEYSGNNYLFELSPSNFSQLYYG